MPDTITEKLAARPRAGRWHGYRARDGADHLVAPNGLCMTCGRADHPAEGSAQDNCDFITGTLWRKDAIYALALDIAEAEVS
jgi:hypothetical protein